MATLAWASSSTQVEQLAPLVVPRTAHTATVLANGSVLITGGRDSTGTALAAAEIFDPNTQTSTAIGALVTARTGHTATPLADGRVLIAGGTNATGTLASAEIFEPLAPSSGFRLLPAQMGAARTQHTATLLDNGKVLIAGGDSAGSAEIFDPATELFSVTLLSMAEPRTGHTATLFSHDTVLLAGGQTDSMETFSAADQTFTLEPLPMSAIRTGHEAIALGDTRLLFFGGDTGNTIEELNLSTDPITLTPKGSMDAPASTATLLANGKILVLRPDMAGIYAPDAADQNSALTAFDETVVPGSSMLQRRGQTATELPDDKKILVAGGVNADNAFVKPPALFNPARIWTDKDDYQPDDPVLLNGSGWKANEDVYLYAVDSETEQWTYESTVRADAQGEFAVSPYFIVQLRHLGVTFDVTAVGAKSTMTADVSFTDASKSLAFTTTAFTSPFGVVFGPITVEARKANGTVDTVSSDTTINLNTNGNGTFFADSAGTTSMTSVVIPKNSSSASFYYKANAVGTGSHTITATDPTTGGSNYGSVSQVETISKASQTITFGPLANKTYGDAPFTVSATASSGLAVSFSILSGPATISGSTVTITGAGTVTVRASQAGNTNYNTAPNVDRSFTVASASATVTLGNLSQTYNGTPRSATATTTPSGLSVSFTYNGSTTAPINAGSYTVVGTINDANYSGSATGTLVITKASATVNLGSLSQTYDGTAKSATATTTPAGLSVSFTYNGSTTAPTNAGSYTVVGTINDTNYSGSATGALVINKATATVHLGSLSQIYDGTAKPATATTTPTGLSVSFTYDGSATAPTNAGSYTVVGTINDTNYSGTATGTLVITKASATVNLGSLSQTYDGTAKSATATTTPAGLSVSLSYNGLTTAPTNAGSYTVVGTIDDDNYAGSGSGTLVIGKANATITVTPYSVTYDGNAHTATGSAKGVSGETLIGLDLSGTTHTNAGTYATDRWSFTDVTGNYNDATGTVNDSIAKANASITVTPYDVTYDGNAHTATGSAKGVKGETLSGLDLSGTTHTNAGSYATDSWTFTDATGNYNNASSTVSDSIAKADAHVVVNGYSGVYDGDAHGASGSASGVESTPANLSSLLHLGSSFTNVPGGTAHWTFDGNGNYNSASGDASIVITKADAHITVDGYTGVYDGNAHGATGSAMGVESTAANLNSLLHLGASFTNVPGGTAGWTFDGNGNYNPASGSVAIVISKADPTITVHGYTGVYDSDRHGATGSAKGVKNEDLSGLLDLGDTFTNVPGGTANWSFAGNINYNSASGTAAIVISKANATITVDGYTGAYDGDPHGATGSAKGVKNEDLSTLLHLGNSFTNVPGGTANWTFDGNGNYNFDSGTAEIVISKADATITVDGYTGFYDGNAHGATGSAKGVKNEDLSSLLHLGNSFINVPGGTANWTFDGNGNYNSDSGTAAIVISKADAHITVNGYSGVYDGNAHGASGSATGVKGENLSGLLSLGASFTNVPGGTASWGFAGSGNYNSASGTAAILLSQADAHITVTGYSGAYDGQFHGATGSATGVESPSPANLNSLLHLGDSFKDVPGGTANWTFDGNTNYKPASGTAVIVIGKVNLTITADSFTKQYSDPMPAFTVKYAGFVTGETEAVLGGTLTFTTTPVATQFSGPGSYTIIPSGLTSGNYTIKYVNGTLTVTQEDARADYSGMMFASTSSPTSSTATVTLSATVRDITAVIGDAAYDTYAGDITKATVTFINRDTNAVIASNVAIGLVTAGDTKTVTATYNWNVDIGSADSTQFTIGIVVNGYYTRNASTDNAVVTVSKLIPGSINGGGYLVLQNSAGLVPGGAGTKNNFGFNVKNTSKGVKGNINIIIRNGVKVYQIKGNAMTSLATQPATTSTPKATATFNGKANIQDITNPLAPISVDGNATLQVQITDAGEPGSSDSIAITVWNKSGGLWFSSNWDGTKTTEKILGGGNLVVR